MLPVSGVFRELMNSNVRPKIELTITIKNALGTGRDLVWKSKNISKMTYKRGIDPVGRTLPFMELRWTEIYQGKLNANSYPDIYENVSALLPVVLKLDQSLGFYNTWQTIYRSGKTWKEIFDSKTTWKQLKENASSESFEFPVLFLSAKPTVKNNTIEWVAFDLLHYLTSTEVRLFSQEAHIWKIPAIVLQNSVSPYLRNKEIVQAIKNSIDNIPTEKTDEIGNNVILDGAINSLLKDFLSVHNNYMDFSGNSVVSKKFFDDFYKSDFSLPLYLQYQSPTVTKNNNISSYNLKRYYIEEDPSQQYEKEWDTAEVIGDDVSNGYSFYAFKYIFKEYGLSIDTNVENALNRALFVRTIPFGTVPTKDENKITVNPIKLNFEELSLKLGDDGEAFEEDNKTCVYGAENQNIIDRSSFLNRYFNRKCDSLEVSCAPNVALETGDIISIETDLQDGFGNNITKQAVIVENELEYTGVFKQKIKAHEVKQ